MTEPTDPFTVPEQPASQQPAPQPGYGPPQAYPPPPAAYPLPPQGYGQQPMQPYAPQATNGMAIASLVLGILWLFWLGSILALVFGYIAKGQIKQTNESGSGLATAGIVLGFIGVGTLVLYIVALVVAFAGFSGGTY